MYNIVYVRFCLQKRPPEADPDDGLAPQAKRPRVAHNRQAPPARATQGPATSSTNGSSEASSQRKAAPSSSASRFKYLYPVSPVSSSRSITIFSLQVHARIATSAHWKRRMRGTGTSRAMTSTATSTTTTTRDPQADRKSDATRPRPRATKNSGSTEAYAYLRHVLKILRVLKTYFVWGNIMTINSTDVQES